MFGKHTLVELYLFVLCISFPSTNHIINASPEFRLMRGEPRVENGTVSFFPRTVTPLKNHGRLVSAVGLETLRFNNHTKPLSVHSP